MWCHSVGTGSMLTLGWFLTSSADHCTGICGASGQSRTAVFLKSQQAIMLQFGSGYFVNIALYLPSFVAQAYHHST